MAQVSNQSTPQLATSPQAPSIARPSPVIEAPPVGPSALMPAEAAPASTPAVLMPDTASPPIGAPTAVAAPAPASAEATGLAASENTSAPAAAQERSVPTGAGKEETTMQELIARVEGLSDDVWRLQQAARKSEPKPRTARASKKREPSAPSRTSAPPTKVEGVVLKAVVDQNAWLQTAGGESVMVSPGDSVPGGGVVKAVDPDSGTVLLSDGRVIR